LRRVVILGCSGAGKSTFARALGAKLEAPVTHLDALFWRPGWVEPEPEAFRSAVATVLVAIEVTLARFGRPVAQRTRQRRMPPASIFDLPLADAAIDQLDRPSGAHPRT